MEKKSISIKDEMIPGSRIYSGRDHGISVRRKLQIGEKDKDEIVYDIVLNKGCVLMASSFFLGCFGDSVRTLGAVKFKEKYNFLISLIEEKYAELFRKSIDGYIQKALDEKGLMSK